MRNIAACIDCMDVLGICMLAILHVFIVDCSLTTNMDKKSMEIVCLPWRLIVAHWLLTIVGIRKV